MIMKIYYYFCLSTNVLTSKKALSSIFFDGTGAGGACETDWTSAKSKMAEFHEVQIKN